MEQQPAAYQLVPFPKAQQTIAVALRFTAHKQMIHVETEVDITTPRQVIHEQKMSMVGVLASRSGATHKEKTQER